MMKKDKEVPALKFSKKKVSEDKDKRPEPKAITFKPIGARVLVLFPQSDWETSAGGLLVKTGLTGVGYRMDGMVVAVGTKDIPEGVSVGSMVYADPRLGDVLNLEGTRYHLLNCRDLMAVASPDEK